jgi:hypothetical protein
MSIIDKAETEGLSHLLRAKSKEDVQRFLSACFRHRHDGIITSSPTSSSRLASTPAVADLGFGDADANARHALCASGVAVVRRALYESAEAKTADHISTLFPTGLDSRLSGLIAGVLVASLPSWRESAIEQRVGLPRLQQLSWQVEVLSASSEQTISNEPIVTLSFTTSGGSDGIKKDAEEMLAPRTFAVTMNQASLGTLLASMRRIKESLAAL